MFVVLAYGVVSLHWLDSDFPINNWLTVGSLQKHYGDCNGLLEVSMQK